jgi:hypothetical protein
MQAAVADAKEKEYHRVRDQFRTYVGGIPVDVPFLDNVQDRVTAVLVARKWDCAPDWHTETLYQFTHGGWFLAIQPHTMSPDEPLAHLKYLECDDEVRDWLKGLVARFTNATND